MKSSPYMVINTENLLRTVNIGKLNIKIILVIELIILNNH